MTRHEDIILEVWPSGPGRKLKLGLLSSNFCCIFRLPFNFHPIPADECHPTCSTELYHHHRRQTPSPRHPWHHQLSWRRVIIRYPPPTAPRPPPELSRAGGKSSHTSEPSVQIAWTMAYARLKPMMHTPGSTLCLPTCQLVEGVRGPPRHVKDGDWFAYHDSTNVDVAVLLWHNRFLTPLLRRKPESKHRMSCECVVSRLGGVVRWRIGTSHHARSVGGRNSLTLATATSPRRAPWSNTAASGVDEFSSTCVRLLRLHPIFMTVHGRGKGANQLPINVFFDVETGDLERLHVRCVPGSGR